MTQPSLNADRLFSTQDAAQYLGGVSPYSIHSWSSKGLLIRTKIRARTFYRQSELDRFIREGGKAPAAEVSK